MFNAFKKFFPAAAPQPAFAGAPSAEPVPLVPSKLGGFTDPALEEKSSVLKKIRDYLPGAVTGAGAVFAAKAATGALMASVSAPALATAAAAAGVGAFTNQTVSYIRDRRAYLKEQASIPPVAGIEAISVAAKISRELKAYGNELTTKRFWKGAATKGLVAGSLGAAFGMAASNEAVQDAVHLVKEKAAAAFAHATSINPFQRFAEMAFGTAHADLAPAQPPLPAETVAAATTAPAVEATPAHQPYVPLTPLEKVHYITQFKGSNAALDKMIARAEGGNMQAVKDLAVGLYNGKLGLPVEKDLALQLFKVAADAGNTQAIRDLASITKEATGHIAKAVVETAQPPAAATLSPTGVGEDSRRAAMEQIKSLYGEAPVAEAAKTAPAPEARKGLLGKLAGMCNVTSTLFNGAASTQAACETAQEMMNNNDYVTMRSDTGVEKDYVYQGEPVRTSFFRNDALLSFIRTKLTPAAQ